MLIGWESKNTSENDVGIPCVRLIGHLDTQVDAKVQFDAQWQENQIKNKVRNKRVHAHSPHKPWTRHISRRLALLPPLPPRFLKPYARRQALFPTPIKIHLSFNIMHVCMLTATERCSMLRHGIDNPPCPLPLTPSRAFWGRGIARMQGAKTSAGFFCLHQNQSGMQVQGLRT